MHLLIVHIAGDWTGRVQHNTHNHAVEASAYTGVPATSNSYAIIFVIPLFSLMFLNCILMLALLKMLKRREKRDRLDLDYNPVMPNAPHV